MPDGIIGHLFGPEPGRRHDSGMLHDSNILTVFQQYCDEHSARFVIYGDPAYGTQEFLVSPFRQPRSGSPESNFNALMAESRVHVEYGFGKVVNLWAFIDFYKTQKLFLSRVGMFYFAAVLLTNIHTCYYGSQTCEYFETTPPTIEEYLRSTSSEQL
jgi:hypothetical protein